MTQRLKQIYYKDVVPDLQKEFLYKNIHQVPTVKKIVINCGLGDASQDSKSLEFALQEFSLIAGQKPIVTRSKKAIAGFKIRENVPVGICVTLRGDAMYAFLDRLINLALPRIRDFQGLNPNGFDGRGNLSLGLKEQLMFPEIDYDRIDKIRGMDISIVTTGKTDAEALSLLRRLGMPFPV
uniref:ribosomal protein L5 n=1 Tax=Streptofilum capillatum TaxID=2058781 RepID=UPI00286B7728|nr:ribosomal protein L5 [Streptofilum capillatum]WKT08548.1 ribosomal protein L5 [Streptofilum capillatum]WKT08647.1 ribosomal protein L5 [Streptofilum sp. BC4-VF8pt]WKT08746.1 ribosomal protein L5 [Streptofilum sp. ZNP2-VF4pt]